MKNQNIETLEIALTEINKRFDGKVTSKWKKERDMVTASQNRHIVAWLARNCNAVEKLKTGKGFNNYKYIAPLGFNDYINKVLTGYANLSENLPTKEFIKQPVKKI